MKKFEYKIISGSKYLVHSIQELEDEINELGSEGWEIKGVGKGFGDYMSIIMEREKIDVLEDEKDILSKEEFDSVNLDLEGK